MQPSGEGGAGAAGGGGWISGCSLPVYPSVVTGASLYGGGRTALPLIADKRVRGALYGRSPHARAARILLVI